MNITKSPPEKSTIKLTIEISVDEFLPFVEKAGRKISERMDVPGFRKGQAPLDVIKQKAGEMTVLQEGAELAVARFLDTRGIWPFEFAHLARTLALDQPQQHPRIESPAQASRVQIAKLGGVY